MGEVTNLPVRQEKVNGPGGCPGLRKNKERGGEFRVAMAGTGKKKRQGKLGIGGDGEQKRTKNNKLRGKESERWREKKKREKLSESKDGEALWHPTKGMIQGGGNGSKMERKGEEKKKHSRMYEAQRRKNIQFEELWGWGEKKLPQLGKNKVRKKGDAKQQLGRFGEIRGTKRNQDRGGKSKKGENKGQK